jgi:hypothetical protein
MMRFSDARLPGIAGTGGMSPKGEDGELTAEGQLQWAELIWLAIDAR